jgi:2-aminoadipate transaminase
MVKMMAESFPENVSFTRPEEMSSLELFNLAIKENVAFVPGEAFYANGGGTNTMRLNFSNSDQDKISAGIIRLARVIKSLES